MSTGSRHLRENARCFSFGGGVKSWFFFVPRLFLLRDSQSNPKAFVLTLCHHQKIKHFQILPVSPAEPS